MTPGLCPLCGHKTYQLADVPYCPCEDCHDGGYVVSEVHPTVTTVRRGPVPDKGRSVSQDRAERQESLGL